MNLYAYVGNDPVNMVDPFGLWEDVPEEEPIPVIGWRGARGGGYRDVGMPNVFGCEGSCSLLERTLVDDQGTTVEGHGLVGDEELVIVTGRCRSLSCQNARYQAYMQSGAAERLALEAYWEYSLEPGLQGYLTIQTGRWLWAGGAAVAANLTRLQAISLDAVIANPALLEGMGRQALNRLIAEANARGWSVMALGRGSGSGVRIFNPRGDQYVQWHAPGSRYHFSGGAYWKVSSDRGGTQRFPAE